MARKKSKTISVNPENKAELLGKNLANMENEALKEATEEILGGASYAAGFSQTHAQFGGGWGKSA